MKAGNTGKDGNPWGELWFNASAFITFTFRVETELDPEKLWETLQAVDKLHPWRAQYVTGEPAPSINWHGKWERAEMDNYIDRSYTIEIRPHGFLTQIKFYAYWRYATNLAEKLSEMYIAPNLISVGARVSFIGVSTTYPSKFLVS